MEIEGAVALVTGANRGLGAAFARALLDQGAARVYGAVRDPEALAIPGVEPVRLDVTSMADVAAAAETLGDVTLLVNNAGISTGTSVLADDALGALRRELETNTLGPVALSRAFAPTLAANGGGAIVNVLSVLSWFAAPQTAMYCASKAASWSLTNSLRQELAPQGTQVVGVHCGYLDTDMAAAIEAPKTAPEEIVRQTLDALRSGAPEVVADDISRTVRAALSADLEALYPAVAGVGR